MAGDIAIMPIVPSTKPLEICHKSDDLKNFNMTFFPKAQRDHIGDPTLLHSQ